MSIGDVYIWFACGIAGVAIGGLFFGGLWWTVERATSAARPALWHALSMFLRTGVTLVGFYWVGAASWPRMLACLAGFVLARLLVVRLTDRGLRAGRINRQELSDAPQP